MPSVAYDIDADSLEFAARADTTHQYQCPECKRQVAYVPTHERGESHVRSFFRYDNCGHRGVVVVENGGGGGGGGGAGGESKKHKRRKYDALQVALTLFPDADYALEERIGEKQPDAKLVFDTPHSKYGKGLAIEYQHKNESKDIEATQEHFAKREFTTVWLWDEQYDYSTSPPDIDFLDGEVYTPWPDAVPKREEWRGLGHAQKQYQRWRRSHELGIKSVAVPATTFRDWFIPTQKEYWKHEHEFSAKYRAIDHFAYLPRWKERFPDYGGYEADHYRLQAAIPKTDISIRVPATVPNGWFWPTTKEYWQRQPWAARFNEEELYPSYPDTGEAKVTATWVNEWLLADKKELHERMGYAWESDDRITVECENCSSMLKTDPISNAESVRSVRCRHCGEWNVQKNVHKKAKA